MVNLLVLKKYTKGTFSDVDEISDGHDYTASIMNSYEFIRDYNMRDCDSELWETEVYLVEGIGAPIHLHREIPDWNGCHIVFARDDTNEVVVDGYGEDH